MSELGRATRTLAVAVLAAAAWSAAGAGEKVFPYPTHTTTLPNGLRVVTIPMDAPGLVAYWTIVRTGSRDEVEPERTGFAHFFEHMMFRGTERFPAAVYNATVTRMGADANASTTDDLTSYHLAVASSDLERVMELESDRFQNLAYSKSVFETEAGAVYGEYRKNRMSPFFTAYEAVRQKAFTRHTYGHTTIGYEADIKRMPELYDYSIEFFKRFYRPDNVVLLIAGDVDPSRTAALAARYYGDWKPGYQAPAVPQEPEQKEQRRVEVSYDGRSLPMLWIAYKAGRFDPQDRLGVAAQLLAELSFGETSAIHRDLVLDRQLVESISADLGLNRDPGTLDIVARIKDESSIPTVMDAIEQTIARAKQELPDAQRLADLKSRLRYSFLMRLDTPDHVCAALSRIVALSGGVEAVDALQAAYAAVRPEDIREAARSWLVPERRTIATLRGSAK
jgi:zinc protease